MKKWYQSKTILLAIGQAIAGLVIVFETHYGAVGVVLIVKAAVDAALRIITAFPIE